MSSLQAASFVMFSTRAKSAGASNVSPLVKSWKSRSPARMLPKARVTAIRPGSAVPASGVALRPATPNINRTATSTRSGWQPRPAGRGEPGRSRRWRPCGTGSPVPVRRARTPNGGPCRRRSRRTADCFDAAHSSSLIFGNGRCHARDRGAPHRHIRNQRPMRTSQSSARVPRRVGRTFPVSDNYRKAISATPNPPGHCSVLRKGI